MHEPLQARYPPLKFELVADVAVSRGMLGSNARVSVVASVRTEHAASASETLAVEAEAEGESVYDVLHSGRSKSTPADAPAAVPPAATSAVPAPVKTTKGRQAASVLFVWLRASVTLFLFRSRFRFCGFQSTDGVAIPNSSVKEEDVAWWEEGGGEEEEDWGDGDVGLSTSRVLSDTILLRQLETASRARVAKLGNEKRHDRVNRSRKHQ